VFAQLSGLQRARPNCQFDLICLSESIQHLRIPGLQPSAWNALVLPQLDFNVLVLFFEQQLHSKIGVEFHVAPATDRAVTARKVQLRVDDDDWGFVLA